MARSSTRSSLSVIRNDKNGSIIGYQGTIRDITEQKRNEEALRDSQTKLAEAMDLAHLVNWEFDVPTGIFTFNDRFYAMFGTTAEREGGYQMPAEVYAREFVHPDDAHLVAEEVNRTIATTDPNFTRQIEHRIIRRDGEIRHIIVRIAITKDAEGRTVKTHGANQDITERKRAEEELKKSEDRFRMMSDWTYDWEYWIAHKREVVYCSPSIERITGYSAEEFIADKSLIDRIIHPDDRTLWEEHIPLHTESDQSKKPAEITFRIIAKDGTTRWIGHTCRAIFAADGTWAGRRVSNRDITKRKQAEEALARSEQKYYSYVDNSPEGIFVVDNTGHYTDVNRAACTLLGYSREEMLSMTIRDLAFPDELQQTLEQFTGIQEKLKTEPSVSTELRLKKKNGSACPVILSVVKLPDDAIMGFTLDITERKRAEEKLRESEQFLSKIIEQIPDMIFVKEIQDLRFVQFNKAGEDLLGYSRGEMVGKNDYDLFPKDEADYFTRNDRQVILTNQLRDIPEETIQTRYKGARILHTKKIPITDERGVPKYLLGISEDITERKNAEALLKRFNEELEQQVKGGQKN